MNAGAALRERKRKKDTALLFVICLVGSGKTLLPNKGKQSAPFAGYKLTFRLIIWVTFLNLPDSLNQIISLQVVCRMSVYVAVLSVVSPFF